MLNSEEVKALVECLNGRCVWHARLEAYKRGVPTSSFVGKDGWQNTPEFTEALRITSNQGGECSEHARTCSARTAVGVNRF